MAQSALEEERDKAKKLAQSKNKVEGEKKEAETQLAKWENKGKAFIKANQRQLVVDLGGGMTAQVGTELFNWLIRVAAEWAGENSWLARYADLLQSLPHIALGSALYVTEMMLREPNRAPSGWNQYGASVGLIWQQLGLNNLFTAIRLRMGDGKTTAQEHASALKAAEAEIAALRRRLGTAGETK